MIGVEMVDGTLSRKDGSIIRVRLRLTTQSLMGQHGVDDKMVSETELASSRVPDGEYILEYFYLKPHREAVTVHLGQLISRGV